MGTQVSHLRLPQVRHLRTRESSEIAVSYIEANVEQF